MSSPRPENRLPGWFTDPESPDDERFWNGCEWTELTRPGLGLSDYLGPIEPVLEQLLGSSELSITTGLTADAIDDELVFDLTELSRSSLD